MRDDARTVVLRGRGGPWLLGTLVAVCAYLVVDALARGYVADTLRTLPWVATLCWSVYLVLVRPCVRLSDDAAVVVNVLRRHEVPWSQISYVTQRYLLTLRLVDDSTLVCWGAPAGRDRRRSDVFAPYLEGASREVGKAPSEAVSRWDSVALVGLAIGLAAMVVSVL